MPSTLGFGDTGVFIDNGIFTFASFADDSVRVIDPISGEVVVTCVTAVWNGIGDITVNAPVSAALYALFDNGAGAGSREFHFYPSAQPMAYYAFFVYGGTDLLLDNWDYCDVGHYLDFSWAAALGDVTGYTLKDGSANTIYSGVGTSYHYATPDLTADQDYSLVTHYAGGSLYDFTTTLTVPACPDLPKPTIGKTYERDTFVTIVPITSGDPPEIVRDAAGDAVMAREVA